MPRSIGFASVIALSTLAASPAFAQAPGYPYAQPSYPPPAAPPPTQLMAPPQMVSAPPARFDPFAGRFLRGYFGTSGFASLVLRQSGGVEGIGPGLGYSFFGGLDIGPIAGVQLSYMSSSHNPDAGCDPYYGVCYPSLLSLEMVSADLRLHLPTGTHFRPFLQAGLGIAWIGRGDYLSDAVGAGFDAGGGFEYFLGRYFTLGATVLYRGVQLRDYAVATGGDTMLGLLTIEGNLALHF